MELSKANKSELIAHIATLESQLQESNTRAEEALKVANYFASILAQIEILLKDAPFINEKGRFFRKLFWVLGNLSVITSFVELLFAKIKEWRTTFDKLTTPPSQQ